MSGCGPSHLEVFGCKCNMVLLIPACFVPQLLFWFSRSHSVYLLPNLIKCAMPMAWNEVRAVDDLCHLPRFPKPPFAKLSMNSLPFGPSDPSISDPIAWLATVPGAPPGLTAVAAHGNWRVPHDTSTYINIHQLRNDIPLKNDNLKPFAT